MRKTVRKWLGIFLAMVMVVSLCAMNIAPTVYAEESSSDPGTENSGPENTAEAAERNNSESDGYGDNEQSSDDDSNVVYHIDIGVSASASVTINEVTYSESNIQIDKSDFTSSTLTITAVQDSTALTGSYNSEDWEETGSGDSASYEIKNDNVDFVYDLDNLSSSTGSSKIEQVRIGGCFPVGTQDKPVTYTVTLTKTVTLTAEDGSGSTVSVPITLTAIFTYWDDDNDCPGITGDTDNRGDHPGASGDQTSAWEKGEVVQGSGMDFVLNTASTTQPTVTVYKYAVDESGNTLNIASDKTYDFGFSIIDNQENTITGTVTVGSNGVGVTTINVTDNTSFTAEESSIVKTIGNYTYDSNTIEYDYTDHTVTITNYYSSGTTSVKVTKAWNDNNYAGRPTSVTINLLADNEAAVDTNGEIIDSATLSEETG